MTAVRSSAATRPLIEAFWAKDASGAESSFGVVLSHIPYSFHVPAEGYYNTVFYCVMAILGQPLEVEVTMGGGVIDAVLDMPSGDIFVIEMKHVKAPGKGKGSAAADPAGAASGPPEAGGGDLPAAGTAGAGSAGGASEARIARLLDRAAGKALRQIEEKGYCAKYAGRGRKVWRTAIAVCDRIRVRVVFEEAGPDGR
jgi:hypothetical protein